jgi:hypothetical protein
MFVRCVYIATEDGAPSNKDKNSGSTSSTLPTVTVVHMKEFSILATAQWALKGARRCRRYYECK